LTLEAVDPSGDRAPLTLDNLSPEALAGNIALVVISMWLTRHGRARPDSVPGIAGDKIVVDEAAAFGPVCFAQYTVHRGTLKLTAQLAPIERIAGHRVLFEIRDGDVWRVLAEPAVDPLSRTAHARIEGWRGDVEAPYRLRVILPLANGPASFTYEGTIAREPTDRSQLRVACFSCNADHGFPDGDVVRHVAVHRPDVALFLGDQ
jgi:hypothetical protein